MRGGDHRRSESKAPNLRASKNSPTCRSRKTAARRKTGPPLRDKLHTPAGYDTESNLKSITDANQHATNFDYDAYGRVTKTTFPSTLFEMYGYDGVGNLTSKTDRKNQARFSTSTTP